MRGEAASAAWRSSRLARLGASAGRVARVTRNLRKSVTCSGVPRCSGRYSVLKKGSTTATKPPASIWRKEARLAEAWPFGLDPSCSAEK